MKKKKTRMMAVVMSLTVAITGVMPLPFTESREAKAAGYGISNPVTNSDGVTTWDCVYFGNYYQSSADVKEPIKWRVLSVEGDDAFLLADRVLDRQYYHTSRTDDITWSTSLVRSWLNGYSSNSNLCGIDYSEDNFIDAAFTQSEQQAIYTTRVVNDDNPNYEVDGGSDTWDKIYLLSIREAGNSAYGFQSEFEQSSDTRKVYDTAYADNSDLDEYSKSNVDWWLRSPGGLTCGASFVKSSGAGVIIGGYVDSRAGVRPALHLDLSSFAWRNAGKVGSDGSGVMPMPTENPYVSQSPIVTATPFSTGDPSTNRRQLSNPITDSDGVTTWDCVYFGNYYQSDAYTKESIKWRVLAVEDDDAFLLADQNLDAKPYHNNDENVTWEGCTLRSWLNGYGSSSNLRGVDYSSDNFLDNVFTDEEQSVICNTLVVNEDNPFYGTEGGNDTIDKIYLLSIAEASNPAYGFQSKFEQDSDTRIAVNTVYAEEQGIYTAFYTDAGYWWLRSPGNDSIYTSFVTSSGYGYDYGSGVNDSGYAVRPALHLNLSSSVWHNAGKVASDGTIIEESELNPDVSQEPASEPTSEPTSAPEEAPTARPSTAPATVPSADPADLPTASPTLPPAGSPAWWTSKPSMSSSPSLKPSQTKRPSTTTISSYADDDGENYLYSTATTKKSKLKRGQTFTIRKMKYKVTKVNGNGSGELSLIGTTYKKTSRTFTSLKIGSTVTIQGYPCKITAVGNQAFRGYKKLKSITIGKNIRSIGKSAFSSCSGVRKLVIQTTKLTLKTVGSHAFALKAHVKPSMPKKKKKAYMVILQKRCK